MSEATTDSIFCIFCEDIRHEANGLRSVIGWLGPRMPMPLHGALTLPKLCAVIEIRRKGHTPIKSLRIIIRLDDKELQRVAPGPKALADMQRDHLENAEAMGYKGQVLTLNMQMLFFKVEEPGVLRAYVEIDEQPAMESDGLRFFRASQT